jgi:hypothetical protein
MSGILKVGMTQRTPKDRLKEANHSDTWRPPTPYCLEFAKKVLNPKDKEKILHCLLETYLERIHPRREFFRASPEKIRRFFDLIDGVYWKEPETETETTLQYTKRLHEPSPTLVNLNLEILEPETETTLQYTKRLHEPSNPRSNRDRDPIEWTTECSLIFGIRQPEPETETDLQFSKRMCESRPNLSECFKRDTLIHHKQKGIDVFAMICKYGIVYLCDEDMKSKEISFWSLASFTNHNYSERNKREGIQRGNYLSKNNNPYKEVVYKNDTGEWKSCDEVVEDTILTQVKLYQ